MNEYLTAKSEPLKGHPLGAFIRRDIPKDLRKLPFINADQYEIKASVGQGTWTHVPWIAIMNKDVTTSTQRGYYIVYLFNENMKKVYLTIAQGVTETSKEEMLTINKEIRKSIKDDSKILKDDDIYLGESDRAQQYMKSVAAYIPYDIDNFPSEEELQADLQEMLKLYEGYVREKNNVQEKRFVDYIVDTLEELGGQATLNEVYHYYENNYDEKIKNNKNWQARIRQQIYLHSSDTDIFQGSKNDENDLFYTLKGKGQGVWGLRKRSRTTYDNHTAFESSSYDFSLSDIVTHIYQYIQSKGFYYSQDDVKNLFLSLKTKPFVILSGISGTGKTKIAQLFAESIGATEENGQFKLIPVRPDWSDGSDLLGYIDIKGDFKEGPLTTIIKEAIDHPNKPYFVLLDEMNLARVEYYFSDILSVMESRKWQNGEIVSSPLLTESEVGFSLQLPSNLSVIGTVNMDETTHPFSKKVLDRANTIEFNEVDLGNLAFLQETEEISAANVVQERLASKYLHMKDVYFQYKETMDKAIQELVKINDTLKIMHAHVGYRVRDEICFYLAYNEEIELFDFNEALDYCILQKILPRISGSDSRVDHMLKELYQIFTNIKYDETEDNLEAALSTAKYPKSAKKVVEMLGRLEDGFTSFWIA